MDGGVKGSSPGGRKCKSSVLLKRHLCFLVTRWVWGEQEEKAISEWRVHFFLSPTFLLPYFFSLPLHALFPLYHFIFCISRTPLLCLHPLALFSTKTKPPQSFVRLGSYHCAFPFSLINYSCGRTNSKNMKRGGDTCPKSGTLTLRKLHPSTT